MDIGGGGGGGVVLLIAKTFFTFKQWKPFP